MAEKKKGRRLPPLSYPRTFRDELRHPYLLFSKRDVPALRAKMAQPPFRVTFETLRRQAECDLEMPTVGQPRPDIADDLPGDTARGFETIVHRASLMHLLTGEEKYLERGLKEIEAVTKVEWLNEHYSRDEPANAIWYGDLGLGERAQALGLAYDWMYESLSESQRVRILEIAREKVFPSYLLAAARRGEWGTREYFNWNPVINGGVGVLALATLAELDLAHPALFHARWLIPRFVNRVGRDGGWDEGLMYAAYGCRNAAIFALALKNTLHTDDGLIEPFRELGYFLQMLRWKDRQGGHRQFRFRDSNPFGGAPPAALLALFPENRDYLRFLDAVKPSAEFIGPLQCRTATKGYGYVHFDELLFRPDVPLDSGPVKLPRVKHFRDVGIFAHRGAKLLFCALGVDTGANHGQMDMGSFELVYDREHFISDMNYGDSSSLMHSCLTVNGGEQAFRLPGRMHGLQVEEDGDLAAITLELPPLYGPILKRYRRHFLVWRDFAVAIVDEIEALEAVRLATRFTTYLPARLDEANTVCDAPSASIEGETHALCLAAHPAAGKARFQLCEVQSIRETEEDFKQIVSRLDAPVRSALWLHVLAPYPVAASGPSGEHPVRIGFPKPGEPLCFALDHPGGRRELLSARHTRQGALHWSVRAG